MKNRTEEIWAQIAPIIEERSALDIEQAVSSTESCAELLLQDFCACLLSCNEQALHLQGRDEKGATAFIALSFLHSSTITGNYDLRLDFYDDSFLSDISEACSYFSYRHLSTIYQKSVEIICSAAAKQFVRLMDYEKDALANRYKNEVLHEMVKSACSFCLSHPDMAEFWPKLTVGDECVITFGGFLYGQQQLLRLSQKEGASVQ
jgi:hypothetical protein